MEGIGVGVEEMPVPDSVEDRVPVVCTTDKVPEKVVAEAGVNRTRIVHCPVGLRIIVAKQVEFAESMEKEVPVTACEVIVVLPVVWFQRVKS